MGAEFATAGSIVPGTHAVEDAAAALIYHLPGGGAQSTDFEIEWQGSRDGGQHVTVFSSGCDEGTDFIVRIEPLAADAGEPFGG